MSRQIPQEELNKKFSYRFKQWMKGEVDSYVGLVEMQRQEEIKNTKYTDLTAESWSDVERIRKARGYKIQWAVRFAVLHDIPVPHKYDNMRRIIGI